MNKNQKWLVFWLTFAFFVVGMFYFFYGSNTTPGMYDDFAKCLTSKNVTFAGAYWCSHCAEQKNMFGDSMKYINYLECSLPNAAGQNEACNQLGIKGYPTWIINGQKYEGTQTLQELSRLTNCSIS